MSLEWRPVARCPAYVVSEFGDVVRVKPARGARVGKPLKPHADKRGYLYVGLRNEGMQQTSAVACVVAEAFIGIRPSGLEVLHGDGNNQNNHFTNLRYGTHTENMQDMAKHGRSNRGERFPLSKLKEQQVKDVKAGRIKGSQAEIARLLGVHQSHVSRMVRGQAWSYLDKEK